MKKVSSVVWKFFDRIEENKRCVAVLCKLCECQYKYFGNTTNLRVHLINKHPIQWELSQNGTLDESNLRIEDSLASTPNTATKKKYKRRSSSEQNVRYSVVVNKDGVGGNNSPRIEIQRVDVNEHTESDGDDETLNLVRQMHGDPNSDEEWLEDDPYHITHIETYEPQTKRKRKFRKIKREVPSPTGLPGFYVAPKKDKIIFQDSSRKDEYSVFGEYVANKIKKINNPLTRGNLQQLISTILWQAEYGMYDNADTVRRVLMMNVQTDPEPVEFETELHIQNAAGQNKEIDPDPSNSGDSLSVLN